MSAPPPPPYRTALPPAAAGEALRSGDPKLAEAWRALAAGEIGAIGIGRRRGAPRGAEGSAGAGAGRPEDAASRPAAACAADGRAANAPRPRCLLPGSFNPVHSGHRRMLQLASARLDAPAGAEAVYELAIANPDKPPLSPEDAAARLARFTGEESVWLTRAPTFPEKARVFPGATFAVGVDTIVRIAALRYYDGPEGRDAALDALRGCRFLVFGRRSEAGFETLDSVTLPASLRGLCEGVPEARFRADVSSTELRRRAARRR